MAHRAQSELSSIGGAQTSTARRLADGLDAAPFNPPTPRILVRAGVPHPGSPDLLRAAREHRVPILVSANAFSRSTVETSSRGEPWKFSKPNLELFEGLDVALDSAGFVAMSRYNGYLWSVDEYLDLVESFDWTWWASMDLCTEPELASNRIERRMRVAQTAANYRECRSLAADRGLPAPMPVLQGQTVSDYLRCAELMPLLQWPRLVGIGSMCRRDTKGRDNIEAVVKALDRELPGSVAFHLFGVKSESLDFLADHPRIASTDSCAWSMALRRKVPVGRNRRMEAEAMVQWWHAQRERQAAPKPESRRPFWLADFASDDDPLPGELETDLDEWTELVANGEADMFCAWRELSMRLAHAG